MATISETGVNGLLKQAPRHAKILERIKNGEELTITQLSLEWNVSTKTLQRDFDTLLQLGHPIKRSDNKKSFIQSNRATINDDATIIVEMLHSMSKDIGGEFYIKAEKLLKNLEQHITTPYYTRVDVEDITSKFDLLKVIESAIKDKKIINIIYSTYDDKNTKKEFNSIKPLKILTFNGFWYLLCEHNKRIKKFYLKSISNVTIENTTFKINKKIYEQLDNSLNVWFNPNLEPYEVILFLKKNIVQYFQRKPIHKSQKLYLQPDGSAELIVKITSENEIIPLIKNWLPDIYVIEPQSLQETINKQLETYLQGI